jgi:hypothetical protein
MTPEKVSALREVRKTILDLTREGNEILMKPDPGRMHAWYLGFENVYNDDDIPEAWKTALVKLEKRLSVLIPLS